MTLHDKILPGHFILNYGRDCTSKLLSCPPSANKLEIYPGFGFHNHEEHKAKQDEEVLDLSRRCDSVETRKTPSPDNSTYSYSTNSPNTHCSSPPNPTTTTQVQSVSATSVNSPPSQLPPITVHPKEIPPLYPLYYPTLKSEVISPPPPPVSQLPIPLFGNPTILVHPDLKRSPKSEDQKCISPPLQPKEAVSHMYPNILNAATTGSIHLGKATRPFNAYPRDPALVAAHFSASDVLFDNSSMERYSNFRKRALNDIREANGGQRLFTNPKMRRTNIGKSQISESEERTVESKDYETTGEQSTEDANNNDNSSCNNNESSVKDEAYFERRRKNNAAAKKSRDRRRIKEDEIAIRAAYLERQNIELLCQIEALKKQLKIYMKV